MIDVLRAAGFRVLGDDGSGNLVLRRGARSLRVPVEGARLAARFEAVLTAAGMDGETFRSLSADVDALIEQLPASSRMRGTGT